MSNGVYDEDDILVSNVDVLYCRAMPESTSVVNRTLGGLWFVQGIGDPAIKAEVELEIKGMIARDDILDFYANTAPISIKYDGYNRTGYINGEPTVELVRRGEPEGRLYRIDFALVVITEVAL